MRYLYSVIGWIVLICVIHIHMYKNIYQSFHLTDIPRYPLNQLSQYANEHLWLIALFSHLVSLFWLTTLFNVYKLVSITGTAGKLLLLGYSTTELFKIDMSHSVVIFHAMEMRWSCDSQCGKSYTWTIGEIECLLILEQTERYQQSDFSTNTPSTQFNIIYMITSWLENVDFRFTGPFWGEPTPNIWIPLT